MSPFARSRGRFCPGKPEALQQARHDIVSGEDRQRDAGQRRVAGGWGGDHAVAADVQIVKTPHPRSPGRHRTHIFSIQRLINNRQ